MVWVCVGQWASSVLRSCVWCLCGLLLVAFLWPLGEASATKAVAPVTVRVDLSKFPKQEFRQFGLMSLYRQLLVRLTQADFAVVGAHRSSQIWIELRSQQQQLSIQVATVSHKRRWQMSRAQETLASFQLGVVHRVIAAARQLRWQLQKATQAPRPKKAPRSDLSPKGKGLIKLAAPAARPNPWGWELGLGGTALYRVEGTDPLFRLTLRGGQEEGWGVFAVALFSPSLSEQLAIYEWGLQIGPSWRQRLLPQLFFDVGVVVGFMNHIYLFTPTGETNTTQGSSWDGVGQILLTLSWKPLPSFGLRLWTGAGLALQSRVHNINQTPIWERSLARFELGGSVFLSF